MRTVFSAHYYLETFQGLCLGFPKKPNFWKSIHMATRDKPLKDLVGVWPIFGYKFWIQILHSDLERGDRVPVETGSLANDTNHWDQELTSKRNACTANAPYEGLQLPRVWKTDFLIALESPRGGSQESGPSVVWWCQLYELEVHELRPIRCFGGISYVAELSKN